MKANEMGKLAEGNVEATEPEVATPAEVPTQEVQAEPAKFSQGDVREELKRFVCEFGEQGAYWYIEGISFAEAQSRKLEQLKSENEKLRKELELSKQSESVPLSQGGGDPTSPPKTRGGFVTNIRLKD